MEKIKLYSIGNDNTLNHYILDKKQEVIDELFKIFYEVFNIKFQYYRPYTNKKGKRITKKINFNKIKYSHETEGKIIKNEVRVDIFYGNKKLFVTIFCSQKLRLKFNEALFKVSVMSKYKHPKNVKKN